MRSPGDARLEPAFVDLKRAEDAEPGDLAGTGIAKGLRASDVVMVSVPTVAGLRLAPLSVRDLDGIVAFGVPPVPAGVRVASLLTTALSLAGLARAGRGTSNRTTSSLLGAEGAAGAALAGGVSRRRSSWRNVSRRRPPTLGRRRAPCGSCGGKLASPVFTVCVLASVADRRAS